MEKETEKGIVICEGSPPSLKVTEIKAQVNLIQEVMHDVMIKGEHYGVIPGTGNKPTLLKAGAEKLIMTFRLVPDMDIETIESVDGHREVRVKAKLYTQNGVFLGAGVGACSTKEGKYRYRTGTLEFTDTPIPKEYWDMKKEDPIQAQTLIGGKGFVVKKTEQGQWAIGIIGEKAEHDNPADYYNTVLKMAKKRALVDAVLTVTAASDIFIQDVEDMPEVIPQPKKEEPQSEKKTYNWRSFYGVIKKNLGMTEEEAHQLLGLPSFLVAVNSREWTQESILKELKSRKAELDKQKEVEELLLNEKHQVAMLSDEEEEKPDLW